MRETNGGCEAILPLNPARTGESKSKCDSSLRLAHRNLPPAAIAPIRFSAPASPTGFRVNCTAEASARNSRCRETAAWISRPNNTPMLPITHKASPERNSTSTTPPPPPFFREPEKRANRKVCISSRPHTDVTRIPNSTPKSQLLSRMSPFRMWLYSWAITPCSSSRFNRSSAPRVTAMAASRRVNPAANALIPGSPSSTNTRGTGTPHARAISSTTLSSLRSSAVGDAVPISRPPADRATAAPPSARVARRQSVAPRITVSVTPAVTAIQNGSHTAMRNPLPGTHPLCPASSGPMPTRTSHAIAREAK